MAIRLRTHLTVVRDIELKQEWLNNGEGNPPKTVHQFVEEYKQSIIEDPMVFVDAADAKCEVIIEVDDV